MNITGDSVARCCLAPTHLCPARVNQHVAIIRPNSKVINPEFLRYYLISPPVQNYMLGLAAAGATRNALTKGMIEDFEIPYLPLSVQDKIATILSSLDNKIENNRKTNETLEATACALYKSWFVDFDPVRARMEGRNPEGIDAETAQLFPRSFDESGLGEIPKGWEMVILSDLVEFLYGKALKEGDRRNGSIPVYGSNGIVGYHDQVLSNGPGIVIGRKGNAGTVVWAPDSFFAIDTTFYVRQIDAQIPLTYHFLMLKNLNLTSLGSDSAVPGLNRNMAYLSPCLKPGIAVLKKFDEICSNIFQMIDALEQESKQLSSLRDLLIPELINGRQSLVAGDAFYRSAINS